MQTSVPAVPKADVRPALLFDDLAVRPEEGVAEMNALAAAGVPFLFAVDSWGERWVVREATCARALGITWHLDSQNGADGVAGTPDPLCPDSPDFRHSSRRYDRPVTESDLQLQAADTIPAFHFVPHPVKPERYRLAFNRIRREQVAGNCWLANLTFPALIDTDLTLADIAKRADAPFRLHVPDQLTVFSPERFVRVTPKGQISTYPMKGTLDATLPDAARRLLSDTKEAAEHVTVVDLLRNDLGMVARHVRVPRYRYITEVKHRHRHLLQVSSEITGELGPDWRSGIGDTMKALLPAGSVTGSPKNATARIIRDAEEYERGWYTGIFGMFDGYGLDSAVMIRFIERTSDGRLIYKSGGGITIESNLEDEYAELKAKIYVPFG